MSSAGARWRTAVLLVMMGGMLATTALIPVRAWGEQHDAQLARKVKSRVAPVYPEVARRMSITGTVKVMVVVTPGGAIKSAKVVGGHPLLVNSALEALRKWKFEPAANEDTGIVEFKFEPQE